MSVHYARNNASVSEQLSPHEEGADMPERIHVSPEEGVAYG